MHPWKDIDSDGTEFYKSNEYWYQIENGKVSLTKYIGEDDEITIPLKISGYPVEKLGEYEELNFLGTSKKEYLKVVIYQKLPSQRG